MCNRTSSISESDLEDLNHNDDHIFYLRRQSRSLRHDNADLGVTGSWVVSFVSRERVGFLGVLESPVKTIYIGDSPCDLDASTAVDTGMIKRDSEDELRGEQPELKRTVSRLAFGTA